MFELSLVQTMLGAPNLNHRSLLLFSRWQKLVLWLLIFQHDYGSFFLYTQNAYQLVCTEEKAPDDNMIHKSLQNCDLSIWSLPHIALMTPRIWRWLLEFGKFVDCCFLLCNTVNCLVTLFQYFLNILFSDTCIVHVFRLVCWVAHEGNLEMWGMIVYCFPSWILLVIQELL